VPVHASHGGLRYLHDNSRLIRVPQVLSATFGALERHVTWLVQVVTGIGDRSRCCVCARIVALAMPLSRRSSVLSACVTQVKRLTSPSGRAGDPSLLPWLCSGGTFVMPARSEPVRERPA
jgi:hypothetical protein